ncbi:MAG: alpha/beta hydrolase [Flavobacteriales bacterium]|nr:alpha/beta hydrolase [Flavobacteriales bacterium]
MKNTIYFFILSIMFSSCFRLDEQFFNREVISSYGLDDYTGERELSNLPAAYDVDDDKVHLFSLSSDDHGDVQTIYAIYLGEIDSIATDTVVVYCHGNKFHMDLYWNRAKLLANAGGRHRYGVLMMDYRGYGMSTGNTTESGLHADVNTCVQWLRDHGLTNDRMIMYGYSLGSAPATYLSANTEALSPHKLILEAPFASAEVMVQDAALAALPSSYFTNIHVDNAETIKSVSQPLCWIHGVNDDFLQITTHGEVVYGNYHGEYKEAHRISGGVHNNVPAVMGYDNYLQVIEAFIKR